MVKNLPCSAGDGALIPGQETKIPHATEELNLHTATTEPPHSGSCVPQLETVRQRKIPQDAAK